MFSEIPFKANTISQENQEAFRRLLMPAYTLNSLEKNIKKIEAEHLLNRSSMNDIVKFNKKVCLENGLSFYIATGKNKDLAEKVSVIEK